MRGTHQTLALGMPSMIDPFGRRISYLRVSVTDRCDLRCVYCMAEDMTFLPKREVLTLEELDRLCGTRVFRPPMFGIAAAHLGPDVRVGIGPEAR